MKCPTCVNVDLHMSERQGIEIDYCPKCRGVWLDRGELDKFIQQSEQRLTLPPIKEPREEAWTEQSSRTANLQDTLHRTSIDAVAMTITITHNIAKSESPSGVNYSILIDP